MDTHKPRQPAGTEGEQTTQSPENTDKSRRVFLTVVGGLGVGWVAAGVYPVYRYLSPRPQPDPFGEDGKARVDKIVPADVAKPGQGKSGAYAGRGLVLFRDQSGKLKAFDSKCTHAGCNVVYQGDKIFCHCHGGIYDLDGKNVAGPPPAPLARLTVVEEEGVLYVRRPGSERGAAAGAGGKEA